MVTMPTITKTITATIAMMPSTTMHDDRSHVSSNGSTPIFAMGPGENREPEGLKLLKELEQQKQATQK
jgi:hypothetical protein